MDSTILDRDPAWMRAASIPELSEFLHKFLEPIEGTPRYAELKSAFDAECERRSSLYYEKLNNGEWI